MATTLQYNFVACSEEGGVLTVGFADDQFNTQEYFLFQNWLEAEGEDGQTYIERSSQERGTYGGIERFVLHRDYALLTLLPETAKVLQTEQDVRISFSASDEQYEQLASGLEIVFAGEKTFERHD